VCIPRIRRRTASKLLGTTLVVGGAVALAGCSSGGSTSGTTTTTKVASTTSSTVAPTTSSTPATSVSTSSTSSSTTSAAENLPMTSAVEAQLLAAEAAAHNLPASAYTGLVKGSVYYAYDPATGTYWAGAAATPSSSSEQAEASVDDNGAYGLYERVGSGSWTERDVAMTGIDGDNCTIVIPADVLALWGWAAGTCRPPT
jgi:hypothetical protein